MRIIIGGLGQCVTAMVAAQRFNQNAGALSPPVYGAVNSGTNWRFLTLMETTVSIDPPEYFINQIAQILGILLQPFQPTLATIES